MTERLHFDPRGEYVQGASSLRLHRGRDHEEGEEHLQQIKLADLSEGDQRTGVADGGCHSDTFAFGHLGLPVIIGEAKIGNTKLGCALD